jgi:hypothetical protein
MEREANRMDLFELSPVMTSKIGWLLSQDSKSSGLRRFEYFPGTEISGPSRIMI